MTGWLVPLDIPVQIGRDEARQRAVDELAKAKYGGTPDWLSDAASRAERLAQRFVEMVLELTRVRQASGTGVNWGFVLAVVVLIVAIGLVVWRVGLPRWQRQHGTGVAGTRSDGSGRRLSAPRGRATPRAATGRAAVRDRFRALVRELETQTILDVRPARTAREAAYSASQVLPDLPGGAARRRGELQRGRLRRSPGRCRRLPADGRARRPGDASGRRRRPGRRERPAARQPMSSASQRTGVRTAGRRRAGRGGGRHHDPGRARHGRPPAGRRPAIPDAHRSRCTGAVAAGSGHLDDHHRSGGRRRTARPVRAAPWSWPTPTN